jgi:outer membrane protein OmpA-like peptidoglycan-associated protein
MRRFLSTSIFLGLISLGAAAQMDISGQTLDIDATLKDLNAKVVGQEIRIALAADVLFDFDKHELKPVAFPTLGKVAEVLKAHADTAVVVEGHTDGKGADAYNQALSERRAASVRDWLVKNAGQPRSRFTVRGFGKARPVAPNAKPDGSDDSAGRERNRRVEIAVKTG